MMIRNNSFKVDKIVRERREKKQVLSKCRKAYT